MSKKRTPKKPTTKPRTITLAGRDLDLVVRPIPGTDPAQLEEKIADIVAVTQRAYDRAWDRFHRLTGSKAVRS